ncbi:WD40-repeat-containing domain protein [Rhypophila decipiens]|uniref:WD40-repeat-containing domain protein n=1 Tax=Rhypophila decipiens TaxID=261697 RepID=A0AAN6XX90_9PEZI|nr:WD40-repeat-containing domain protein [Rhypophila decipiens]
MAFADGAVSVAASPPERRPATPPSTITGTRPAPPSSRLSRSNTSATTTVHHREKDLDTAEIRESDGKHADEAAQKDSSTATGIGPGSSANTRANTLPISPSAASTPAIDPLSQHIFLRTNEAIPQRLRNTAKPDSSSNVAEGFARLSADLLPTRNLAPAGDASKDKRKGPSFLSRLSMRGSKKHDGGDFDTDSELGSEVRMDGINARVFSQTATINSLGGGGYIPHHKEPPRYIRTKSHGKKNREFNRVFLAQELVGTRPPKTDKTDSGGNGGAGATETGKNPVVTVSGAGQNGRKVVRTGGAVWATEFSKDGKYLAAGGRDNVVRIWAVISTPEERKAYEEEENANGGTGERLSAPVFRDQPIREFEGHTGEVLDLSWSKNNFLLSSSMDKTVRLWHISRNECLCTFKHKDFVTRLAFHPRDDRFFLAGSLDTMLRLWSIPDKAVAFSAQLPDLVTAVAFSPDGKTAIAGLRTGLCLFYETEGLTLQTQLHVRSSRGKNAKGSKITGIQTMAIPPANSPGHLSSARPNSAAVSHSSLDFAAQGEVKVLITSNDSRVRIYSLREKALDIKLKGHDNACSQIAATFSDDGKYVICGSEDRKAFIWSLSGDDQGMSLDKDKSPCEYFEAHGGIVTTALFAPTATRMLLGQSGDPIYDLCNPPPVMLRSLEEAASIAASQTDLGTEDMHHHSETAAKKPELSPAYLARSTHYDGHILVTTDDTGIIKVFRQDCAYLKRRQEAWESGSAFSRKLTGHGTSFASGGLGRSVSVLTRTSAGTSAHSRRGSLSRSQAPGATNSPQLGTGGASSDRILSWRQGIEHGGERRASGLMLQGSIGTPTRSERSLSPTKAARAPLSPTGANLASDARKLQYHGSSPMAGNRLGTPVTSPTASVFSHTPERIPTRLTEEKEKPEKKKLELEKNKSKEDEEVESPPPLPTPSFTFRPADEEDDDLRLDPAGASYSFWNLNRWKSIAGFRGSLLGNSGNQEQPSGHSRSPSKSRKEGDEEDKEQEGRKSMNLDKLGGRRQSMGKKKKDKDEGEKRRSQPGSSLFGRQDRKMSASEETTIPTIINTRPSEDRHGRGPYEEIDEADGDEVGASRKIDTILSPSAMAKTGLGSSNRESSPYGVAAGAGGGGESSPWSRGGSYASKISSELSSEIEERREEEAAAEEEEEEVMKCTKCGSASFKAKKIAGRQRLSCRRCGLLVGE